MEGRWTILAVTHSAKSTGESGLLKKQAVAVAILAFAMSASTAEAAKVKVLGKAGGLTYVQPNRSARRRLRQLRRSELALPGGPGQRLGRRLGLRPRRRHL